MPSFTPGRWVLVDLGRRRFMVSGVITRFSTDRVATALMVKQRLELRIDKPSVIHQNDGQRPTAR